MGGLRGRWSWAAGGREDRGWEPAKTASLTPRLFLFPFL